MQREIMVKELEINEVSEMLEKSEEQYKNGKTYKARTVFEELRKKYNYQNRHIERYVYVSFILQLFLAIPTKMVV